MISDATDTTFEKVDYCIIIDPISLEQVQKSISRRDSKVQTFNQTNAVWHEVIAISIETKVEAAATIGEAQLAIWTKGWLNQMCLLLEKLIGTLPEAPPLPMLRVHSHASYILLGYYDNTGRLIILGEQHIGSTRDL
ncbi:hypothetical protein F4860DRAFT_526461 [Xylaria cubensis]|nr:hypothetical protein F4860DRAFT_526461 [Xylaria cubensis]